MIIINLILITILFIQAVRIYTLNSELEEATYTRTVEERQKELKTHDNYRQAYDNGYTLGCSKGYELGYNRAINKTINKTK